MQRATPAILAAQSAFLALERVFRAELRVSRVVGGALAGVFFLPAFPFAAFFGLPPLE